MSKWYGLIGYAKMVERKPGVWEEELISKPYYGELIKNTRKIQSGDSINDDITIANELSILADIFANNNITAMRYVEYLGTKWKITNVNVSFPRLILTIGGVYNV